MEAPQIILIGLFASNLYEAWICDREEDAEGGEFLAECISIALWLVLLFWGGFFA